MIMNEINFWKGISLVLAIVAIISLYNTYMSQNNTEDALDLVYEYKSLSEDTLKENYKIRKHDYEVRISNLEINYTIERLGKQIPVYIKYLNNTNNYSSCWTENGTRIYTRKDDCYNCQNFTENYLDNIKDEEYETYYISGHIKGHEFGHAFAKVCRYVNPTENELMSNEQLSRYKITKEELWKEK